MSLLHIFGVLLCFSSYISASELEYDGWLQLRLWHSFSDSSVPEFVERGNITISSVRSGGAVVAQTGLVQSQVDQLKLLAKNDRRYMLKAIARTSSGSETTFLTSVMACNVVGSELEDTIYIWLDSAAEPIAVNMVARGPCTTDELPSPMWTTNVQVKYPDGGPVPDTTTYIQKLEREKQARESGETKDNRSFFAKYWMYIVPVLIFFVLTSATNPDGAGGGGGGAAQRQ